MSTSHERSPEAALKAPVKQALMVALGRLDRLVHHGAEDYAQALEAEAGEPHRHPATRAILQVLAKAARDQAGHRKPADPAAWGDSPHDEEPRA